MSDAVSACQSILQTNALDLFCVAAHYSERYECADNYLEIYSDDLDLAKYTMYFRGKTPTDLVQDFAKEYIICSNTGSISISTMEYLWRKYLKERQYPTILGQSAFLTATTSLYSIYYDEQNKIFKGLTSPSIQSIEKYQRFWNDHICVEFDETGLFEYEIEELVQIYREATGDKRMTETQMIDLIRFYNPDIQILDNKYVLNVFSDLWNKKQDLAGFFQKWFFPEDDTFTKMTNSPELALIPHVSPEYFSFYDAYTV